MALDLILGSNTLSPARGPRPISPHLLVTQCARHTVGMIENISFPTHTLTPISLGQNCLVFSNRSGGHAGS